MKKMICNHHKINDSSVFFFSFPFFSLCHLKSLLCEKFLSYILTHWKLSCMKSGYFIAKSFYSSKLPKELPSRTFCIVIWLKDKGNRLSYLISTSILVICFVSIFIPDIKVTYSSLKSTMPTPVISVSFPNTPLKKFLSSK